jgi:hypothetical protein
MSVKNQLTPSGIEPATFLFVAQHLSRCATAPAALYPGKDLVSIVQEAGWDPGPGWTGEKSRLHRDSISDRPARSSVAIPTEIPGPQV